MRRRLSLLSVEVQTSQSQPMIGMPCDVPVPRNVIFKDGKIWFKVAQISLKFKDKKQPLKKDEGSPCYSFKISESKRDCLQYKTPISLNHFQYAPEQGNAASTGLFF